VSEQRAGERVAAALPGMIERDSPVPYYFQLATLFEHEILSGRWPAGTRLASEPEIGRHYQLSRTTVRQALARLEQQGALKRVRGQGTYVAHTRPRSWMLHSPLGLFQGEMHRHGQVTSRVLRAEVAALPSWSTDALGLPPGSSGVTLERLRAVDGLVVLYVVNHLPVEFADVVLGFQSPDDSLYQRLRDALGIEVVSGIRNIEAVDAEARMAALLEVPPGAPLALIESVSWDESLRPFDCYRAWVRTDRMKIEIQISASTGVPSPAEWRRSTVGRTVW
jgi:GntR family transcriptional regulator